MTEQHYDIVVIGAGIQGAGVAQAAAAAGYSVAVMEKTAIAAGTSSRSSKLIHGGLRYLETGQFALVRKTLKERQLLLDIAPSLVKPIPFYIPIYKNNKRKSWQIRIGLSLYALLAGFNKLAIFKTLSIKEQHALMEEGLLQQGMRSVFQYWDAQTDDSLLTQAVMKSAEKFGAKLFIPAPVESVSYNQQAQRFQIKYRLNNQTEVLSSCCLVNAAGPWVNKVLETITPVPKKQDIDLVQGAHIVLDTPAPKGIYYLEAPQDHRAVFVMPWKNKTLLGTTETAFRGDLDNVRATDAEVQYLIKVYQHYFPDHPTRITERFAGLRVLPKSEHGYFSRPRDVVMDESLPGLITLYGGKLTGYRVTAEQVLERLKSKLPASIKSVTTENITIE